MSSETETFVVTDEKHSALHGPPNTDAIDHFMHGILLLHTQQVLFCSPGIQHTSPRTLGSFCFLWYSTAVPWADYREDGDSLSLWL